MDINKNYISDKNTYRGQNKPKYIVIHETDNFSKGAGAKRHASAQAAGHLSTSVHYYAGSDGVYQAAEHQNGTYSVGKEYGGSHSVKDASNRNTINIEICVNSDGDYAKARGNAIELVKDLIKQTGIPADRVIRHFDAKGKYCPRKMMDTPALWEDFRSQIGQPQKESPGEKETSVPAVKKEEAEPWYRVGSGWENGICQNQTGAYHNKDFAIKDCKPGQKVYDEGGKVIYANVSGGQTESGKMKVPFQVKVLVSDLNYRSQPSMSGTVKGQTGKGVFTITEVQKGWGRLKSGAGWIYLENPKYCKVL